MQQAYSPAPGCFAKLQQADVIPMQVHISSVFGLLAAACESHACHSQASCQAGSRSHVMEKAPHLHCLLLLLELIVQLAGTVLQVFCNFLDGLPAGQALECWRCCFLERARPKATLLHLCCCSLHATAGTQLICKRERAVKTDTPVLRLQRSLPERQLHCQSKRAGDQKRSST